MSVNTAARAVCDEMQAQLDQIRREDTEEQRLADDDALMDSYGYPDCYHCGAMLADEPHSTECPNAIEALEAELEGLLERLPHDWRDRPVWADDPRHEYALRADEIQTTLRADAKQRAARLAS